MRRAALATLVVVGALEARAGETDNYYAWVRRIDDGTAVLDERLNAGFAAALAEVNAGDPSRYRCDEVARLMLARHARVAYWFVIGATEAWGFDYAPSTDTEMFERYEPIGLYRYSGLLPLGGVVPLDPTVYVAGVHFGTDKLGHFLTNGPSYYDVYARARAEGMSHDDAVRAAIDLGVWQESGILGAPLTSVFSYADLESNYQGLKLIHDWCLGDSPELVLDDHGWRLTMPFTLARYVNPCWDESFYPSAYVGLTAGGVKRRVAELCPLTKTPRVEALRRRYRARGCTSASVRELDERLARGQVPDPSPFSIEHVCGQTPR